MCLFMGMLASRLQLHTKSVISCVSLNRHVFLAGQPAKIAHEPASCQGIKAFWARNGAQQTREYCDTAAQLAATWSG